MITSILYKDKIWKTLRYTFYTSQFNILPYSILCFKPAKTWAEHEDKQSASCTRNGAAGRCALTYPRSRRPFIFK